MVRLDALISRLSNNSIRGCEKGQDDQERAQAMAFTLEMIVATANGTRPRDGPLFAFRTDHVNSDTILVSVGG